MADILAGVVAEQLCLSTDLFAAVSSIAALPSAVAKLPTGVKTTQGQYEYNF